MRTRYIIYLINTLQSLAEFVNSRTSASWSANNAEDRYNGYLKKYKQTRIASEKTGFGCTDKDLSKEPPVDTIEKKLDDMCPHFGRLDILYVERQNISPADVAEVISSLLKNFSLVLLCSKLSLMMNKMPATLRSPLKKIQEMTMLKKTL